MSTGYSIETKCLANIYIIYFKKGLFWTERDNKSRISSVHQKGNLLQSLMDKLDMIQRTYQIKKKNPAIMTTYGNKDSSNGYKNKSQLYYFLATLSFLIKT